MKKFMNSLMRKLSQRSGQSLVEYTMVIALVVMVCIVALTLLGTNASKTVASVAVQLN
ncbi:MAG: Flp family type IVb pilin [Verrucomicrobiia bacterium]